MQKNRSYLARYKKNLKYIWMALIALTLGCYLIFPGWFSPDNFVQFRDEYVEMSVVIYTIITIIRAVFFIPSTITLLIGITLFPDHFWFLLIINMIGIIIGSLLLYFAGVFFEADAMLSPKYINRLPQIREKINRYGFWIVLGWSFFPFVPTDLICYVSGSTRMPLRKYVPAIFMGECSLVILYLITGQELIHILF